MQKTCLMSIVQFICYLPTMKNIKSTYVAFPSSRGHFSCLTFCMFSQASTRSRVEINRRRDCKES